jgi:hypothetical protein
MAGRGPYSFWTGILWRLWVPPVVVGLLAPLRLLHPDAQGWRMRACLIGLGLFAVAFLIARRWVNQLSRTMQRRAHGVSPLNSGS